MVRWIQSSKITKTMQCEQKKDHPSYFDKVTKEPENHLGLDHITLRRKGNKVVYADKYEELENSLNKNKSLARKEFLKWLEDN